MANASQKTTDLNTSTKSERWYLGEGVSRIIDGDTSYLVIKVGDFPESQWAEWDKDCKENFSNCRWAKMMNDHTKAKMTDLIVQNKFSMAEQKEKKETEIETFGGGENDAK